MLFSDTYLSIDKVSEGIFKDRGSKFIARAIPVKTEEEVKKIISTYRKEYHDACHHCYAFRVGADKAAYRSSDDGEPSGTAGKPILGQILSNDLTNILIVVIRYFGGTLLGVPGLINAYRTAAAEAIKNANIVEMQISDIYEIHFDYPLMNDVMRIIKESNADIVANNFELSCVCIFRINKSKSNYIYDQFSRLQQASIKYLRTE